MDCQEQHWKRIPLTESERVCLTKIYIILLKSFFSSWICLPPGEDTQVYFTSEEPEIILRDSLELNQTEKFKISQITRMRTLRLSSKVSGRIYKEIFVKL